MHAAPVRMSWAMGMLLQVIAEVRGGLDGWAKNDRWNQLGITEQVQDSSYQWAH
jgi:hypothetical protein